MRLPFFTLLLASCPTSYGQIQSQPADKNQQQPVSLADDPVVAILPFDPAQYWVFKDGTPTSLTKTELKQLDKLLKDCIDIHNTEQEKQFLETSYKHPELEPDRSNFVIDLTRYKRQYIAVLNSKGEKEVWVNCFCNDVHKNWKDNLIFVKDGGNCYFNVKMNLTRQQHYDLIVNGNP